MNKVIVGLVTEGFNPSGVGGINTWINQLTSVLPEIDFKIINITSKLQEIDYEKLPINVSEYIEVPIWAETAVRWDREKKHFLKEELQDIKSSHGTPFRFFQHLEKNYSQIQEIKDAFLASISNFQKFYKIIENLDLSLIHTTNVGLAGLLGTYLRWITKKPLLVSEHGSYINEWKLKLRNKFFPSEIQVPRKILNLDLKKKYKEVMDFNEELVSYVLRNADMILPVTGVHIKDEIKYGADPRKIHIIRNGVPMFPNKSKEDIQDAIKIGMLTRVNPIKNIELAIDVMKILINQSNKYELHIAGPIEDYDYFYELKSRIEEYNVENKIFFYNSVWETDNWLECIDTLILTSISEGLPYALLEGISRDIPIVTTDVGGVRELPLDDKMIVQNKNPNDFAKRIRKLSDIKYKTKNIFDVANFKKNIREVYCVSLAQKFI